jgi:hypothetical protein
MDTSLDARICHHVRRYLSGEISLQELEDWLVPATWDVHRSGNARAEQLASDILLHLAEHSDGWLSEAELRCRLRDIVALPASRAR